jgi:hypothetical protein
MDNKNEINSNIKNMDVDYGMDVDIGLNDEFYFIPNDIGVVNSSNDIEYFEIIKNKDKIDDYDIKKSGNELVLPLKLYEYKPDETFNAISLDMFIIFISNAINKINIKYNKPIVKSLKREDMILIDLDDNNIKMHRDGLNILQNLTIITKFNDINIMRTSDLTVFIPICIIFDGKNNQGHFNILIINNNIKTISLYEPFGGGSLPKDKEIQFKKALKYIKENVLYEYVDYKFIGEFRNDGVQYRNDIYTRKKYNVPDRYCVAWCAYICLFKLYNMHLKTKLSFATILNYIYTNLDDQQLNDFIRRFVSMIKESTDNYTSDVFSTVYSEFIGYNIIKKIDDI